MSLYFERILKVWNVIEGQLERIAKKCLFSCFLVTVQADIVVNARFDHLNTQKSFQHIAHTMNAPQLWLQPFKICNAYSHTGKLPLRISPISGWSSAINPTQWLGLNHNTSWKKNRLMLIVMSALEHKRHPGWEFPVITGSNDIKAL